MPGGKFCTTIIDQQNVHYVFGPILAQIIAMKYTWLSSHKKKNTGTENQYRDGDFMFINGPVKWGVGAGEEGSQLK